MSRFFRFFHRLSINVSASWQRNVVSHTTSAAPFHAQKFNRLKNKNPNLQNAKCKSNVGRDCLLPHIWHTHTHTHSRRIHTNQWNIGHRTIENSHHPNIYAFHHYFCVSHSLFERFAHEPSSFPLWRLLFVFDFFLLFYFAAEINTEQKPIIILRFFFCYSNTYKAARRFMQFCFNRSSDTHSLLPLLVCCILYHLIFVSPLAE